MSLLKPIVTKLGLGKSKEQEAKRFLQQQGLKFVEQNFHCKYGEIDLIFTEPQTQMLVFVEVRYRKNDHFGGAAASITPQKQAKIKKSALFYLTQRRIEPQFRFDVIAFNGDDKNWIQSAFS